MERPPKMGGLFHFWTTFLNRSQVVQKLKTKTNAHESIAVLDSAADAFE